MRAADLKPGVEYSTCNGDLVVPVEPIHGNWFRVYDVKRDVWELVDGGDQPRAKADPWGGCHRPTKASEPRRRRSKPGVLMDRHNLTLYADVVRRKVDQAAEEAAKKAAVEAITAYLAAEHGVEPSDVSLRKGYGDESDVRANVSLRLKVPRSRAKNPPDEYVRAARALGIEVSP